MRFPGGSLFGGGSRSAPAPAVKEDPIPRTAEGLIDGDEVERRRFETAAQRRRRLMRKGPPSNFNRFGDDGSDAADDPDGADEDDDPGGADGPG